LTLISVKLIWIHFSRFSLLKQIINVSLR